MVVIKKDVILTTIFNAVKDPDVINKAYLDEKLIKINGHISFLEKDCIEFKLEYNKKSKEEILIQRAVKTTIQINYEKSLFDNHANADAIFNFFVCYKASSSLRESN